MTCCATLLRHVVILSLDSADTTVCAGRSGSTVENTKEPKQGANSAPALCRQRVLTTARLAAPPSDKWNYASMANDGRRPVTHRGRPPAPPRYPSVIGYSSLAAPRCTLGRNQSALALEARVSSPSRPASQVIIKHLMRLINMTVGVSSLAKSRGLHG